MKIRHEVQSTAVVLALMLSSCATGAPFSGQIRNISSAELKIVRSVAHVTPAGVVVDGDVRRPDGYAAPLPGFLEIDGLDRQGRTVAQVHTTWGEFKSRRLRRAYFRALIPVLRTDEIASIKIKAHT